MTEKQIKAFEELTGFKCDWIRPDGREINFHDKKNNNNFVLHLGNFDYTAWGWNIKDNTFPIPVKWLAPLAKILEDKDEKNISN